MNRDEYIQYYTALIKSSMVVSINVTHRQVWAYHTVFMNELGIVVNEETARKKKIKENITIRIFIDKNIETLKVIKTEINIHIHILKIG